MSDDLLTAAQVHDTYGIAQQTLANHRWRGTGPAYVKISPSKYARVRYRRSAIEQWLDECTKEAAV